MSKIHILELSKGDNVIEAVKKFAERQNWAEGIVQGALGSVVNVRLNNAAENVIPPRVQTTEIEGPFEILSCTGEIIRREEGYYTHIHTSGSLSNSHVFGGGLQAAEVFKGLKVYLQQIG